MIAGKERKARTMEEENGTAAIIQQQRAFFAGGTTRSLRERKKGLSCLLTALKRHENEILAALTADLGKSLFEGYSSELLMVRQEIQHCLRFLSWWSRPQRKTAGLINFPASGFVYREPYGVALIISPWNYPVNLCLMPLVGAVAAGNCVLLKTSEFAPHTSRILQMVLAESFPPQWVSALPGELGRSEKILQERFDYIFFTGSPRVGRLVMQAASKNLTPVSLELGGKSPCLVCDDCDLKLAARRIVWGKLINAGQTCVAPDYILVSSRLKPLLIREMKRTIREFFGDDPLHHPDYPRIIHERAFSRLCGLLQTSGKIVFGGVADETLCRISPTILDGVSWDDPIMQEEIFGPLFPALVCESVEEMIEKVREREKPLALYLFTNDRAVERRVLQEVSFGGGCVNDTIMHLTSGAMPFGGVGNSGMGRYHGKYSFLTFSHEKSILKKSVRLDLPLRYPPYPKRFEWLKRLF